MTTMNDFFTQLAQAQKEGNTEFLQQVQQGFNELFKQSEETIRQLFPNIELPTEESNILTEVEISDNDICPKLPDYTMVTNRLVFNLFGIEKEGIDDPTEPFNCRVSPKGKNKKVYQLRNCQLTTEVALNDYDWNVMNALFSIWKNGKISFTPQRIFEEMNGNETKSSEALAQVEESLDKLRKCGVRFDGSEHLKMKGLLQEGETFIVDDPSMIPLRKFKKENSNGTVSTMYMLLSEPALFDYSNKVNQLVTVKKEVLKIENTTGTRQQIVLKNYLIRRITTMSKKTSNIIRFDSIFKQVENAQSETPTLNRTQKKRIRELTFNILDDLMTKEQSGKPLFKTYKKNTGSRNSIESVSIIF